MSLKDKAEAAIKDIEGKIQEEFGDITGNLESQAEGQNKQMQADAMRMMEEIRHSDKKAVD